jgi:hypothetical protein
MTLAMLSAFVLAACTGMPSQLQSVEVETSPQGQTEMEFTGAVDSIGSNAWSIGGLVVGVTASTEIQGEPVVGDLVKVHALVLDGSTLVAREIARAAGAPGVQSTPIATPAAGQEIEFFGSVVDIASDAWLVGDQTVAITSATEIKGTISIGDSVKVHALVQPDLSLTAREIEPATEDDLLSGGDDSGDTEDVELKGIVEKIEGDEWTVASVTFIVPAGTEIDSPVQVGDTVEIHAIWSAEGVLTAIRVHLEDGPGDDDSADDSDDDLDDDSSDSSGDDDDSDDSDDDHGGDDDDGDADDDSGPGSGDDNSGSGG